MSPFGYWRRKAVKWRMYAVVGSGWLIHLDLTCTLDIFAHQLLYPLSGLMINRELMKYCKMNGLVQCFLETIKVHGELIL